MDNLIPTDHDGETVNHFVEFFVVPSWEEHLRQHNERLTGVDRQFEEQADALSDPPPHDYASSWS